jgi:hypothetical protein
MTTLGKVSRLINYVLWGEIGESLCARIARRFGTGCWFCRVIARIRNEPDHCRDEMK